MKLDELRKALREIKAAGYRVSEPVCDMCRSEPARKGRQLGEACWRVRGSLDGE